MPPSIPLWVCPGHGNDPGSHHDSPYLPLCVAGSCHTQNPIKKVYADKGYFGKNNREFLHMTRSPTHYDQGCPGMELTPFEKDRNKAISRVRYIVEQYFGLSHLHTTPSRQVHEVGQEMSSTPSSGRWPSISSGAQSAQFSIGKGVSSSRQGAIQTARKMTASGGKMNSS